MKGNTRRYARKQITWFKRDPQMRWFTPDKTVSADFQTEEIINHILKYEHIS